jgi:uncharacterized metal-binding protein YceD (DUF177 family)
MTVADLPEAGVEVELEPDEASRAALARHVDVLSVPALVARLRLQPDGRGGATVEGVLEGRVRQSCVVTLEPFDNPIRETISLRFVPVELLESQAAGDLGAGDTVAPDPLVGGKLDLAGVVAEFLSLAVDPYPRKPGAVFTPPAEEGGAERSSAFAALAKLKARPGKKR